MLTFADILSLQGFSLMAVMSLVFSRY